MRLIDADALLDKLICTSRFFTICGDIIEAPTIDAVRVVRCKDCEYWIYVNETGYGYCENLERIVVISFAATQTAKILNPRQQGEI